MDKVLKRLKATAFGFCMLSFLVMLAPVAAADIQKEVENLRQQIDKLERKLEMMHEYMHAKEEHEKHEDHEKHKEHEKHEGHASGMDNLSIGGFGELHYNNWDADDSSEETEKDEIDFHRFVLFFEYDYSDKLKFKSELELEHSVVEGGEESGEIQIEQAYAEYSFNDQNAARVGVFLLPVGIMNKHHAPPTFYGVERNEVESVIIPSGWWAGGLGYTYRTEGYGKKEGGLSFDVSLHEGLKVSAPTEADGDATMIEGADAHLRGGRQKTAGATLKDPAATFRVNYTGIPDIELGAALQYQSDITQESGDGLDDAYLYEIHSVISKGPFGLRALYAEWDIDTDSGALGDAVEAAGSDEQEGWYIEPSYRFNDQFGVFARYEDIEGGRSQDQFDQWSIGLNWWIHKNVVLKADYVDRDHDNAQDDGRDFDGYNLGFGYQFNHHDH